MSDESTVYFTAGCFFASAEQSAMALSMLPLAVGGISDSRIVKITSIRRTGNSAARQLAVDESFDATKAALLVLEAGLPQTATAAMRVTVSISMDGEFGSRGVLIRPHHLAPLEKYDFVLAVE